jgi:cation transport ATPase
MHKPTSSESLQSPRTSVEPFAIVAVVLAIVFMATGFEAELLWMLHEQGSAVLQKIVSISCFFAVLIPFLVSCHRLRTNSNRWKGGGLLVVTGIILALNVAQLIVARHFRAI